MAEIEDALAKPLIETKPPLGVYYLKFAHKAVAEAFGTFLLLFTIASLSAVEHSQAGAVGLLGFAISAAFCIIVIIFITGGISGAHVNPAITIGFAVAGQFPWQQVHVYVISQIVGAISGTAAAQFIYNYPGSLALTVPLAGQLRAFAIESFGSFVVMFVACTVSHNSRVAGPAAALGVPAVIGLAVMTTSPISGGSLNPARSLGPAIIFSSYNFIWIYIIGPLTGSCVGALTHAAIHSVETPSIN